MNSTLVAIRCSELSPKYAPGSEKRTCKECGEMTWVSTFNLRDDVDIICKQCYLDKYYDKSNVVYVTDQTIQKALDTVDDVTITRDELIKIAEKDIGKKIVIVKDDVFQRG